MNQRDLELIARKFPVSDATRKRNQVGPVGSFAADPQQPKRLSLERVHKREKARGLGHVAGDSGGPYEVRITVYAVRPADWDGYHIKEIVDALVKCGCMGNDDWRVNPTGTVTSKKVHTKEEERTQIEVIPLCTNGAT